MNKMCYKKIFSYELRRMLQNKIFISLLLANGLFSWFVLSTDIIRGVAYTAPFSTWSYCTYLGKVLPLAMATVLLLLANYYSKKQISVEILISTTPIPTLGKIVIRTLTAGICFGLICIVDISLVLLFYQNFFEYHAFAIFILPSVLLLLPCFLLFAGLGQLLGSIHRNLIYGFILFSFLLCGLRNLFDVFGAGYFSTYPLTLPVGADGEPAFQISIWFLVSRLFYFVLGIVFIYFTTIILSRKSRKA